MIPSFRAWWVEQEVMCDVDVIGFSEGAITVSNEDTTYVHLGLNEVELMQSTRLKDINGVEIFEGDILKHIDFDSNQDTENVVYMKHGSLVFDVEVDEFVYDVPVYRLHSETSGGYEDTLEIIGNIYESPELLEVAE